jgi:hypothetical protein
MVDPDILLKSGSTDDRLREIFTETDTKKDDFKTAERIKKRVVARVLEGIRHAATNSHLAQAVDMAWDSTPIQKQIIPLLLHAQGKLSTAKLFDAVQGVDMAKEFCKKEPDGTIKVDMPRLYEISINLVRSYTTRRHAAQCARFANLYPHFSFDTYSDSPVGKCRGDVVSSRVEVIGNQYNYRHFFSQAYRDMFLYGRTICFPSSPWDKDEQWYKKFSTPESETWDVASRIVREGVDLVKPHYTRTYYDTSSPLPNINTDTGPSFIGYYDIIRYGTFRKSQFFNADKIMVGDSFSDIIAKNKAFFGYYFDPCVLTQPDFTSSIDRNSRSVNVGLYTSEDADKGLFITHHFERIVPIEEGIGEYPFPVWVRFTLAGDDTVVGARFFPSIPAIYGGINENDDRMVNISMAHEIMPFQDQLSNILSQLLLNMKANLVQIWAIDKDCLEPEMRKYVEDSLKAKNYYVEPKAWFYSGEKLKSMGFDPKGFIQIIRGAMNNDIDVAFNAIVRLLGIVERLLILSPNELGQAAPREISAREVTEIASSTGTMYDFISEGIDELRGAAKKLIYESYMMMGSPEIRVPVLNRYSKTTLKKAGFSVDEDDESDPEKDGDKPRSYTLIGTKYALQYDFIFTNRDGVTRASNVASATALGQLLGQMLAVPQTAQALGKERTFEIMNEIFRLAGVFDLKMELDEGETDDFQPGELDQVKQQLAQIAQIMQQQQQRLDQIAPQAPGGPGGPPPPDATIPAPPSPAGAIAPQEGMDPGAVPAAMLDPSEAA